MTDVTQILNQIAEGDSGAAGKLLPLLYDELRKLARQRMAQESPGQTLQPTALVHEAYLRLVGSESQNWNSRGHFFGAAAEAMRRILVDNARRKQALKRGGKNQRAPQEPEEIPGLQENPEILEVDEALDKLGQSHPQIARLVVLRYFGGLTLEEAAASLDMPIRTAHRRWAFAKAWLRTELQETG
jgi:RNA polymerase sigma factor (TIGR02999 family)